MTPTKPGYYWATPDKDFITGGRQIVCLTPYIKDPGLGVKCFGSEEIWDAHLFTDWHGPIVEQCAKCLCGKVFSADEGGAWITCPACGGSGRRR